VPLGVIPKNENKREEIVEILEIMHKYVPKDEDKLIEVSWYAQFLL
jgi:septum formation topological specificity factor MinE